MAQVVFITEEQDMALAGLAKQLATDMETGRRPFGRYFQAEEGSNIIFQKLVGNKIRALISVGGFVVGYGRKLVGEDLAVPSALTWSGKKYRYLSQDMGESFALACSKNGNVIAGYLSNKGAIWENRVYSELPNGGTPCIANGVSTNGGAIAGWFNYLTVGTSDQYLRPAHACRWDDKALTILPTPSLDGLPLDHPATLIGQFDGATAISADGSTVVGFTQAMYDTVGGATIMVATVWRGSDASVLPSIGVNGPGRFSQSRADGVSGDGRKIVGSFYEETFVEGAIDPLPVLWVDGVPEYLENDGVGSATGISSNGTVIIGRGLNYACKWVGGKQSYLDLGTAVFTDTFATGVSSTGRVITGRGVRPGGFSTALKWVDGQLVELGDDLFDSVAYGTSG